MSLADQREDLLKFIASLQPGHNGGRREMDSLTLLQVVVYLEEKFGLSLAELGVGPDDLRSIEGVMALIEKHDSRG